MSRIEELREIRAKVEAGEVDSGTLEQLVYGLAAEVEVRLHNEACQRAELETCNAHIDDQAAQLAALRAALGHIAHHAKRPGDTFCGFAERLKRIAQSALAATADREGETT